MTNNALIKHVVQILNAAGYRVLPYPFLIANISFEFAAFLAGTERASDLIVVVDTTTEPNDRTQQKLESLARALDILESRRPLNTVLVGPSPTVPTVRALCKVSRVFLVNSESNENSEQNVARALAVLLPLNLPAITGIAKDPIVALKHQLQGDNVELAVYSLLEVAPRGRECVQKEFLRLVEEPLVEKEKAPSK